MTVNVTITVEVKDSTFDVVLRTQASGTTGDPSWLPLEAEDVIAKAGRDLLRQVRALAGDDIRDWDTPPRDAASRGRPLTGHVALARAFAREQAGKPYVSGLTPGVPAEEAGS